VWFTIPLVKINGYETIQPILDDMNLAYIYEISVTDRIRDFSSTYGIKLKGGVFGG